MPKSQAYSSKESQGKNSLYGKSATQSASQQQSESSVMPISSISNNAPTTGSGLPPEPIVRRRNRQLWVHSGVGDKHPLQFWVHNEDRILDLCHRMLFKSNEELEPLFGSQGSTIHVNRNVEKGLWEFTTPFVITAESFSTSQPINTRESIMLTIQEGLGEISQLFAWKVDKAAPCWIKLKANLSNPEMLPVPLNLGNLPPEESGGDFLARIFGFQDLLGGGGATQEQGHITHAKKELPGQEEHAEPNSADAKIAELERRLEETEGRLRAAEGVQVAGVPTGSIPLVGGLLGKAVRPADVRQKEAALAGQQQRLEEAARERRALEDRVGRLESELLDNKKVRAQMAVMNPPLYKEAVTAAMVRSPQEFEAMFAPATEVHARERLADRVQQLERRNRQLDADLASANQNRKVLEGRLMAAFQVNEEIKSQHHSAVKEVQNLQSMDSQLSKQSADLVRLKESQLSEADGRQQLLTRRAEHAEAEIERLKEEGVTYAKVREQQEELMHKFTALQASLHAAQSAVSQRDQTIASLRSELAALRAQRSSALAAVQSYGAVAFQEGTEKRRG